MEQLYEITKPFPNHFIREAGQGRSYVPHGIMRQRLLQILGPFDWESGPEIIENGKFVGMYGKLTVTIDGIKKTIKCIGTPQTTEDEGNALKQSETDAFKRCALQIGLGLHLWTKQGEWFLSQNSGNWQPNHDGAGVDVKE